MIEAPVQFIKPREPKPEWLKVRAPGSENYVRLKGLMKDLKLNTVCEDARCPNIGECWHHGTATFMILGDVCTRACAYCAVAHGRPNELDLAEPARVAEAVARMHLQYAVITSVDRDDLKDGGASIFAETIRLTRERVPSCRIEVLTPDFQGVESSLRTVLDAGPDVLNHNTETVPRLYRKVRSGGRYTRTLELLDRSRQYKPEIATKTGIMVGLGEERDEVLQVFEDLRRVGVSILTIGQYLRPSATHAPMTRYYHPDEFADLKREALARGFVHVESGPLVRSSYHAHEQADAFESAHRAGGAPGPYPPPPIETYNSPVVHRLSRIRGFHMHATDGNIGHIDDFLFDEGGWQVRYLVVDTSNWLGGKWVAVSPLSVTRVDWAERTLHVDLTREQVRSSPSLEEANVPGYELTPRFIIM